jgi:hypothetical protein
LAPHLSSGRREAYAEELDGLWVRLSRALRRLEQLAADTDESPDLEELARLRYTLHVAGEEVAGLVPPVGAEAPHAELAAALADARDATADVAEAVELDGVDGLWQHLHEWRGSLFRVRLARLRLAPPGSGARAADEAHPRAVAAPLVACILTVVGAAAFVLGATTASWPIWAAGMLAVVGGLLAYRP